MTSHSHMQGRWPLSELIMNSEAARTARQSRLEYIQPLCGSTSTKLCDSVVVLRQP